MRGEPFTASILSIVVILAVLSFVFARAACAAERRIEIYKHNQAYWREV